MNQDYHFDDRVRLWQKVHPVWWAVVNFLTIAYGMFVAGWDFHLLLYVFWMELIFTGGMMLIRVAGAMEYRGYFVLTGERIIFFFVGGVLSTACVMLPVALTFDMYPGGLDLDKFAGPRAAIGLLWLNHLLRIILHYFANGTYQKANPATEMMATFVYMFGIVVLVIAIALYYIPRFPHLDQARSAISALLFFHLFADLIYSGFHHTVIEWFTPPPEQLKKKTSPGASEPEGSSA